ncbi:hypothetical protein JCM11251_004913 [Rhodosporidiobolus azoricus]
MSVAGRPLPAQASDSSTSPSSVDYDLPTLHSHQTLSNLKEPEQDTAPGAASGSSPDEGDEATACSDRRSSQATRIDELQEKESKGGCDEEKGTPSSSSSPPPAVAFPDGGFRAWSVVAGAWCISFTSWGVVNSFGVFQTYYQANQLSSYSRSEISWIGSVQLSMVLGCAIFAGKFFDAGYIKYLLVISLAIYIAGMFGFSEANSYYSIFLGQGLACGLAGGIAFTPSASCISHWFKYKRARAMGILATGSSVGGMIYPAMLNHLFPRIGFGWTVRAVAFLTIALAAIAAITIDSRLPPRPIPSLRHFVDFSPLREKPFLLLTMGCTFVMWGLYFGYFYIQNYALANGVPRSLADYSLTILNAASIIGRVGAGFVADKCGCLATLGPLCAASGVLVFLFLPMCKSSGGLIAWCLLFGCSSGAYVSMMPSTTASISKDMTQIGHRMATACLIIAIAGLTGNPICGAIIAAQGGSYTGAVAFSGVTVLVGSGFIAASWRVISRERGTWRV